MTSLLIGKGDTAQTLLARYANRHGLVAGATGTGKTVTLQVMAEGFSALGVPVFCADVKGDLSGLAAAGADNPKLAERAAKVGVSGYAPAAQPVMFWDVFGEQGHPIRTTLSEMGPLLLARLLSLSDAQSGALAVAFKYADDQGLALLDLKDLTALLRHVAAHSKVISAEYGLVSTASLAAIQRALLQLEQEGGAALFGEPALELADLMRTDLSGRGIVNVLAADKLFMRPRLYATFLLFLLSELFESLPEVGDLDQPRLVFFFDEAHLLFKDAPKALVDKVEQVVRLIRSKGVGVYFVTQNPLDLPETVLGQLGNRVQHGLRAFTPRDQKAVRAAAETFRANPGVDVIEAITQMGVGEALVSTLQDKGIPSPVERAMIAPPRSRMGPLSPEERRAVIQRSPVFGRYEALLDRESAYEILARRTAEAEARAAEDEVAAARAEAWSAQTPGGAGGATARPPRASRARSRAPQSMTEKALQSAVRSAGSAVGREVGRQVLRGLLGSLLKR
ncbi:MAG: helicase HerA-like domain-containing protein [Pseudomonadota bacterium]|nr:helicase HerA-like domain-containing protein [Pseudomonadota bacterium]